MCFIMFPIIVIYFIFFASSSVITTQVKRSWDTRGNSSSHCVLPPCPKHAKYEVTGVMETLHDEKWPTEVVFTCWPGYTLVGSRTIECYDGRWSDHTPQCIEHQNSVPPSQQLGPESQQIVPHEQQIMRQPEQCVPQPKHCVPESQQYVTQTQLVLPKSQRLMSQQVKSPMEQPRITSASTGGCILPPYPYNGNYFITIETNTASSDQPLTTNITFKCNDYHILMGSPSAICLNGSWSDTVPRCDPLDRPSFLDVIFGFGRKAARGELLWHVAIYDKTFDPYMQICGGTLISNNRVISAAHCFWDDLENQRPASEYSVAAGKLYPGWDSGQDVDSQKSDVKEIRIPPRYQHGAANFQEDIALLTLTTYFTYDNFVMPASLDFNFELDSKHLQEGNLGKVGGWGLITKDGRPATILQVVEIPNIGIERCIAENEPGFWSSITGDKICAGYRNGTAACRGDSGGGLVFSEVVNGTQRNYLRGIVSTAPANENACNIYAWTMFTHILRHEYFIKPWLAARF